MMDYSALVAAVVLILVMLPLVPAVAWAVVFWVDELREAVDHLLRKSDR